MRDHLTLVFGATTILAVTLGGTAFGTQQGNAQGRVLATKGSLPAIASRPQTAQLSGEALFERKCSHCHELDEHDRGPAIRTVFGRAAGHEARFRYSKSLSSRWFNWDEANLDIWLQGPGRMVPGTRMRQTVSNPQERAAIIAYLKQINNNTQK